MKLVMIDFRQEISDKQILKVNLSPMVMLSDK